ncbi:MxaD family protein [Aureimonas sp. SA4125]|uniref:SRPBCC family protein n=1 Tax=Aureimonas sp. SA4125 TaxID=2826993 RepID=UPI001CC424D5|nr:SRPBCC family protein [Aureimonas sp. SA4125]BDA84103.1 MxaD family protein [Aureimonas sp. SA4125]
MTDINSSASDGPGTANAATSIRVARSGMAEAAPDKVWTIIGDFCGIADWHFAVERCVLSDEGGVRTPTLTLVGGATLVEAEVERDDAARTYSYKIVEGPLPVSNYLSTLSVRPATGAGSSEIAWTGSFDAKGVSVDEASGIIAGIYESGIAALVAKAAE